MKRILILILPILLTSCGCLLSQVPPQTIYANQNCEGILPDYRTKAVASDNCVGTITIQQSPAPGTVLSSANPSVTVILTAKDVFGNTSKPVNIPVILIDTVPPILNFPVGQINMTDDQVLWAYKNWQEAVKIKGIAHFMYDRKWTQGLAFADTAYIENQLHYFTNVIKLTDEEYAQYVSYVESNK